MWSPTGIPLLATEGLTYRMSDSETVALRKKMEAPKCDRLDLNAVSLKSDKRFFSP